MPRPEDCPLVTAHGMSIPAIGIGTFMSLGQQCVDSVAHALKVGYRHIDTARFYGNEVECGEGLRASGVARDHVFVTTKALHGAEWSNPAVNRMLPATEESLKRLKLDYVDLLVIHWPNPATPIKDTIADLCEAKRRGLTRNIGISNFTLAMVDEAQRHATEPLAYMQNEYHPYLDQTKLRAKAAQYDMAWASYCPIGKGAAFEEPVIVKIAKAHGKTSAQIVLRWQIQQPKTIAVPKSVTPSRIEENFNIFDFVLSAAEMAEISALKRPNARIVSPPFAPKWDD